MKPAIHLTVEGPLPLNRVMKGVHDMVPYTNPYFSSGLQDLRLINLRFKSFIHLMNTIGNMPALKEVFLAEVKWECARDEEFRPPPVCRARFQQHPYHYYMRGCTDNAALVWLRLLLVCQGSDRMDQIDVGRLYHIISALAKDNMVHCWCHENSPEDFFVEVQPKPDTQSSGSLYVRVFLTSHVEGRLQRIRAIAFESEDFQEHVDYDWGEIDSSLASLPALETLCFVFHEKDAVLHLHEDIISLKMIHLKDSHNLKYALCVTNGEWAQVSCADDGTMREIGPRYKDDGPCCKSPVAPRKKAAQHHLSDVCALVSYPSCFFNPQVNIWPCLVRWDQDGAY
ncbi:hypothetical protein NM688_g1908 [Phlebia brevispora]|uniref:Uncharacterized protein n=1 Tax=Phlebia brevispora TaxID=194682 RepID=A0ACC1TAD4_9APHY|nr:hypothetical protein NM688_g1908 [Phlebia brevispora]